MWHGRATLGTGRAKLLDVLGSIFFSFFLNRSWTITYKTTQNNEKQAKQKQLNVWVASHEELFYGH